MPGAGASVERVNSGEEGRVERCDRKRARQGAGCGLGVVVDMVRARRERRRRVVVVVGVGGGMAASPVRSVRIDMVKMSACRSLKSRCEL